MRKLMLLTAGLLALCPQIFAQYRNFTSENQSNFQLIQIDQYDDATLFFFQVTAKDSRQGFAVNDATRISVNGDYRAYHLQQTLNMPFSSENKSAYLAAEGDRLNFVLVFDRIPLDKPFTMTEKEGKTGNYFNFRNITVDLSSESEKIEADAFVQATDFVVREKYETDGQQWMSYNVNGLAVAAHLSDEYQGLTKVGKLNIVITNDTSRPVTVSPESVTVKAARNERSELVEIPLWDVTKYDSKVASGNSLSVSSYENSVNPVASVLGSYRIRRGNDAGIGEQIILASAEMLARSSTQSKVDAYAAELERSRQKIWNDYLHTLTVNSGETYGGYVSFKDKNYARYVIVITVGGRDYTFYIKG